MWPKATIVVIVVVTIVLQFKKRKKGPLVFVVVVSVVVPRVVLLAFNSLGLGLIMSLFSQEGIGLKIAVAFV